MYKMTLLLWLGCITLGCQAANQDKTGGNETMNSESEPATASAGDEALRGIDDVHWQLQTFQGDSEEMSSVLPDTGIDIKFTAGEIGGSAGCNRYFGRYTMSGENGLAFSPEMGSTQMACPPPINEQESRYLSLLDLVATWNIESNELSLLDESGQALLRFNAAEPTSVDGVTWQATGINNGKGGVSSTASTHLATASFAEGTLSGSGSCNEFNASYEIDGDQITIGPAMLTRTDCAEPEGIMEQEQQYLQALSRAKTYTLAPGKLELRDENGSLQVSFKP